jgi:hypothetical protein
LFLQLVRLGSSCFSREELEEEISNVLFRIPISSFFWVWLGVGMVLYFGIQTVTGWGKAACFGEFGLSKMKGMSIISFLKSKRGASLTEMMMGLF